VIATGFGHAQPRLSLVPQGQREAEEYRRPHQSWDKEERRGLAKSGARGESLDVPTFLRKQMD